MTLVGDGSTEQADAFISFGGGVNIQHPLTKQLSLFGGVAYQNKTNFHEDDFSSYSYDANLGLSYHLDRNTFTFATQYNSFFLNNPQLYSDAYRNAAGATGQWQYDFDSRNQVSVFLQYSNLIYPRPACSRCEPLHRRRRATRMPSAAER